MEVSGVVFRHSTCLSFHGHGGHAFQASSSRPSSLCSGSQAMGSIAMRLKKVYAAEVVNSSEFTYKGHLQYYYGEGLGSMIKSQSKKKKKDKEKEKKSPSVKKQLKLLKGLSKGLSMLPQMGIDDDTLANQVQGNFISEAAEVLVKQLQQLRAEEKELKRKKKEEKAKLKASRMKMHDCESPDSSDSCECGEVIDMTSGIRNKAVVAQPTPEVGGPLQHFDQQQQEEAINSSSTATILLLTQESNCTDQTNGSQQDLSTQNYCHREEAAPLGFGNDRNSLVVTRERQVKRIEVCMGSKCKKSGAEALLEEFERVTGTQSAAVVGCKCMGKCRDGPNVRIVNSVVDDEGLGGDLVRTSSAKPPLCIGVALEDVRPMVANFWAEGNDLNLLPASS